MEEINIKINILAFYIFVYFSTTFLLFRWR